MSISNGQYKLEPHVAHELLKYLEESLTKKEIQQFFETVNYLRDFLPKIAKLTRLLEKMLKKDAPAWGPSQTKAIRQLRNNFSRCHHSKFPLQGKEYSRPMPVINTGVQSSLRK